ncbi:MAG TPA: hypothetical protein VEY32_00530 [Flavisolibacter sp.]|nr:hypothetical protein [Flavisolibacter sp.]
MNNNDRNKQNQQDQNLSKGQNSDGNIESQQNNESLNTASPQPNESLRNTAAGSGRSYDYGVPGSEDETIEGK